MKGLKKLVLVCAFLLTGHAVFSITCLNNFNQDVHAAWDQYDLDYWNCNDQGIGAHPDCERDAMSVLEYNLTIAVVSFEWCCVTDPECP